MAIDREKNGRGPLDNQNEMIFCEVAGCCQYFSEHEKFVRHLRRYHHIELLTYEKEFPSARIYPPEPENKPLDAQELLEQKEAHDKEILEGVNEARTKHPDSPTSLLDYKNLENIEEGLKKYFPQQYNYYQRSKQSYIKKGIPESSLLDNLCFMETMLRDLSISMLRNNTHGIIEPDIETLNKIDKITDSAKKVLISFKEFFTEAKEEFEVMSLHQDALDKAEAFIKSNIGEFAFRCAQCNHLINTEGLPHWAIWYDYEKTRRYFTWNDEIWYLVKNKIDNISIANMAFILRTSILNIIFTGEKRGLTYQIDSEYLEKNGKHKAVLDGYEFVIEDEEAKIEVLKDPYEFQYHQKSVQWGIQ